MQPLLTQTFTVEFKYEVYDTSFSAFGREYRILLYGNEMPIFNGWVRETTLDSLKKYGLTPRQF